MKAFAPATVSVIIPAYGSCPFLSKTLAALGRQTVPPNELIIVHSGETELCQSTLELAKSCRIIRHPARLFAGEARNIGAREAKGTLLAFLDSDVVPHDGWLEAIVNASVESPDAVIVGAIGYCQSGGYWGMSLWYSEFSATAPFMPSGRVSGWGASANMLVTSEALRKAGGFPEEYRTCEDTLLYAKLEKLGHETVFCPSAVVGHANLPGLKNCLKHSYTLGRWSAINRQTKLVRGGIAIRQPLLRPFLWIWRVLTLLRRTWRIHAGAFGQVLTHLPGITITFWAWNVGFVRGATVMVPRSVQEWLGPSEESP